MKWSIDFNYTQNVYINSHVTLHKISKKYTKVDGCHKSNQALHERKPLTSFSIFRMVQVILQKTRNKCPILEDLMYHSFVQLPILYVNILCCKVLNYFVTLKKLKLTSIKFVEVSSFFRRCLNKIISMNYMPL